MTRPQLLAQPARRLLRVLAAPLAAACVLVGVPAAAAQAATCTAWTGGQPPSVGTGGSVLAAVTVLSPCDAWAVGRFSDADVLQTLIAHWNGATWKQVPSPSPGISVNQLNAVSVVSAHNAWAVGGFDQGGVEKTLILRWNGRHWKRVASPNPGISNDLTAVT